MFVGARVKEAMWPEGLGIATYALSQLVAASIDSALKDKIDYPISQTVGTAAAITIGAVNIGCGRAVDFSKGLLYGGTIGIIVNLTRGLWEMSKGDAARMKMTDFAALIPRKVGMLPAGMPAGIALPGGARVPAAALRTGAAPLVYE